MFNRNVIIMLIALSISHFVHAAGTWTATGSMNTARWLHTATLLTNGKVLITGGRQSGDLGATVELYDPLTGVWSNTVSMNKTREQHTATLLPNGKVLIVGGSDTAIISELYDLNTNSWSNTGSTIWERMSHTATLLPNGKVLVTGGRQSGGWYAIATAELYDPLTGVWSNTNAMSTERRCHTATILPNGNVLIVGGYSGSSYLATTELYDLATSTWSNGGSMATPRCGHSATLLSNGKLLVAGGEIATNTTTSSAELYDPTTDYWSTAVSMNAPREAHTATLLPNGKVLVAGGQTGPSWNAVDTTELYNSSNSTWDNSGLMTAVRVGHTATLLTNGKVLVAGGVDNGANPSPTASAELYTPNILPPAVSTGAPSLITSTSATVTGTVNPNGAATNATFDFGLTTNYGTSLAATPASIAATAGATTVSAAKTGLTCSKLYHYRVKAVNSAGTSYGLDKSFTTGTCVPDFVVTSAVLTPSAPLPNGTFSAAVTVKNQGTAAGNAGLLMLWANQATAVTCGATGDQVAIIGTLAAGAAKTVTIAGLTAPAANSGSLRSFVDAACATVESNEANNQLATPYTLARPDFVVTNLVITPVSPLISTAFNVAVTVKNPSTQASDGGQLRLWLNQPTAQTCAATGGDKNVSLGNLAVGASKTLTFSGLTVASVGTKTLQALADATCVTAENDETNNQMVKTYRVTGTRQVDLLVTAITLAFN